MLSPQLCRVLVLGSWLVFLLTGQVRSEIQPLLNSPDEPVGEAIRFGTSTHSRQEFVKDTEFLDSVKDDSLVSLEFKTTGASGILFYVGGKAPLKDHVGLFMQDGQIVYSFDCGSGSAVITSKSTFNDGRWHRVVASRTSQEGHLDIDEEELVRGTTLGTDKRVNIQNPFFVGGLSEEAGEESKEILKGVDSSFPGCIRQVEVQGELWTAEKQSSAWNTTSCSTKVEGGAFCSEISGCFFINCDCGDHSSGCKFQENGLKKCLCDPDFADEGGTCTEQSSSPESAAESVLFGMSPYSREEYTLQPEFLESIRDDSIFSLEFKTLGETGILFFVGGLEPNIDHIALFMEVGKITYVFDCGSGPAVLTSQNTYNDGEWHRVVFFRKGQEGRLVIDDQEEIRGNSRGQSNRMDCKYPFYVGGLSKEGTKEFKNYVKSVSLSFPGCIRNVEAQGMFWTTDQRSAEYKTSSCSNKVKGDALFYFKSGFLVLLCKCGEHSTGCLFKEDGSKECLCSRGYGNKGGTCAAVSTPVDKILNDDPQSDAGDHVGHCALPLVPGSNPEDGIRFGNTPHSRQEFSVGADFLEDILDDSVFSLDFKTSGESGVLFYIGEGAVHVDYAGLFMKGGKIHFVFELSKGSAALVSRNKYNDGAWHHAVFWRHAMEGRLVIDEVDVVQGVSPSPAHRLNVKSPFYVGGLSEEAANQYAKNMRGVSSSFPGCIGNVEVQNILWTPEKQKGAWNTTACYGREEKGTFFSAGGGHVVLIDKFRVGQAINISMEIKPRSLSGVLLAVHGRKDFLILQMIEGRVEFTVDNGDGPITATTYTPQGNHLCDGQFHLIRASTKSTNHVSLSVDDVASEKGLSGVATRLSSTDTIDPLYVGGLPPSSLSKKGVATTDHFVGCVRNLKLNNKVQSMAQANAFGEVTLNTCPTN